MEENGNMTYAQAMQRLEDIMNEIQSGALDIDSLAAVLKEADEMVKFCKNRLYKVDEDVKVVLQNISQE